MKSNVTVEPDAASFSSFTAESESSSEEEEVEGECDISALMTVCTKTLQITVWVNQTFPNYSFGMFTLNGTEGKKDSSFCFVGKKQQETKNINLL